MTKRQWRSCTALLVAGIAIGLVGERALIGMNRATSGGEVQPHSASAGGYLSALDFAGVDPSGKTDSTAGMQAALDAAAAAGQMLHVPAGTYLVTGLTLPRQNLRIACATAAGTTFRLNDNANTYIMASYGYVHNTAVSDPAVNIENCGFDGNHANQTGGTALIVLRTYRSVIQNSRVRDGFLHGILLTATSANGTPETNNQAENRLLFNSIENNNGAGIKFSDQGYNQISDDSIIQNAIQRNGLPSNEYCNIDMDRTAGIRIVSNQLYASPNCDVNALGAGSFVLALNDIDGGFITASGKCVNQVTVSAGGYGTVVITGNQIRTNTASLGSAKGWNMLNLIENAAGSGGFAVTGNVFYSPELRVNAIAYDGTQAKSIPFADANAFSANTPAPTSSAQPCR